LDKISHYKEKFSLQYFALQYYYILWFIFGVYYIRILICLFLATACSYRMRDIPNNNNNINNNTNISQFSVDGGVHHNPDNHTATFSEEVECPICLITLTTDSDEIYELECHHYSHYSCLKKWVATNVDNPSCPICRQIIKVNKYIDIPQSTTNTTTITTTSATSTISTPSSNV
jgi:hypothetical protein